jgi:precorrin-6B methylase 1
VATDVEIARALNALTVTLNDQRLGQMDHARLQQIVTASLGGEDHLHVVPDADRMGRTAWLHDDANQTVGRIELEEGEHWTTVRCGDPQSGGYVPKPADQQARA